MRRALARLALLALAGAALPLSAQEPPAADAPAVATVGYRLSGEAALRPARIFDDGARTYIEWREEQALPAVFALRAAGREEITNGYMRDGVFTIDRVDPVLIFRIDRKWARAVRQTPRGLR